VLSQKNSTIVAMCRKNADRITVKQEDIILLYYEKGWSAKKIGAKHKLSPERVISERDRAIKKLWQGERKP
jgi:DNA-directed RNA polymerase specialized sigma subunit